MDDRSRLSEVRVGAFVVVALVVLIAGSLWIAGSALFRAGDVDYRVLMKDTAGIQAGDRVRMAGVSIGRIRRIDLRPDESWPVVVRVSIREGVGLHADASATIATSGLLGSSFLLIDPGSPEAPPLAPGGEIRGDAPPGLEAALAHADELSTKAIELMNKTASVLDQVSSDLAPIMGRLERILSEENAKRVRETLDGVNGLVREVGPKVSDLLDQADSLAGRLDEGMETVPELMDELTSLSADLRSAIGPDGERLAGLLEAAETGLASAEGALSGLSGNRKEIDATLRDLRDTVANLKEFSRIVKERPFSLVRIRAEPERRPGEGVGE